MRVTGAVSVEEVLATSPAAESVFEILGINACCMRERSLQKACAAAGLSAEEVIDILSSQPIAPQTPFDWAKADRPLSQLTARIVNQYHRHARKRLVALIRSARMLCSAHAGRFPWLSDIRDDLEKMARDLIPHMSKEERFLFPYINGFEQGIPDSEIVIPLFGTIQFPLQSLHHDHAADLAAIKSLRESAKKFVSAEGACAHFDPFFLNLSEFLSELQDHIQVENDILFPRAVEIEKRAASHSRS